MCTSIISLFLYWLRCCSYSMYPNIHTSYKTVLKKALIIRNKCNYFRIPGQNRHSVGPGVRYITLVTFLSVYCMLFIPHQSIDNRHRRHCRPLCPGKAACSCIPVYVHRWCVEEGRICKIYTKTSPIHRTHINVVLLRCVSGKPKARTVHHNRSS
jgi:hypothetical protein